MELFGVAITPLKKTPPRIGLTSVSSLLSPIADESANLSPAKPPVRVATSLSFQSHSTESMLMTQASTGFNPVSAQPMSATTSPPPNPAIMSYSSDSDSGSESDSESSDSDDQSSGEEDRTVHSSKGHFNQSSPQLSKETTSAPPFGSSSGSWDDTYDLVGAATGLGDWQPGPKPPLQRDHQLRIGAAEPIATTNHSNVGKQSRLGKKRKHSSSSQFSLRKVQKLMNVEQQLPSDAEDGGASSNQKTPHLFQQIGTGSTEPENKRTVAPPAVTDLYTIPSSRVSDGEEEGEIPSDDEERAKKPPSRQQSFEVSDETRQHTTTASSSNQGGAYSSKFASTKQEESVQGREETQSLVVSFQLSNIPSMKPKATVEPFYHSSNSTSKAARRRNTVDAPSERESDEVQSRGVSRERGERNVYNRHREDYG